MFSANGVDAAVPADDVERMPGVGRNGAAERSVMGPVANDDIDVVALDEHRFGRAAQVALAVRRVLEELPFRRQVAARRARCGRRPRSRSSGPGSDRPEPNGGPARGARRRSRRRSTASGPKAVSRTSDPDSTKTQLVADCVAVQRRCSATDDVRQAHVGVGQQQPSPEDDVADRAGRLTGVGEQRSGPQVAGTQRMVGLQQLVDRRTRAGWRRPPTGTSRW